MFIWSAKATVIGEVKGVGTKSAAAVCQVIAEMQTLMEMDGVVWAHGCFL